MLCQDYWNYYYCLVGGLGQKLLLPRFGVITIALLGGWDKSYYFQDYWNCYYCLVGWGWDKSYYCKDYWDCHCCFDGRLTQKLLLPRFGIITIPLLGGWDKSYYCQDYWNCHYCLVRLGQKLLSSICTLSESRPS